MKSKIEINKNLSKVNFASKTKLFPGWVGGRKNNAPVIARSEYEISILSIELTLTHAVNCSLKRLCSFHLCIVGFPVDK